MFADAIEKISGFTRPVKFIQRYHGSSEVIPGTATLFFVNENAVAVTCRHVADELLRCSPINANYQQYKAELAKLPKGASNARKDAVAAKFGLDPLKTAQYKSMFFQCVDTGSNSVNFTVKKHPQYDVAMIIINNAKKNLYSGHAVFAEDSRRLRRGDFLCRYGYPFAEFSDFEYDPKKDDINWTGKGRTNTPPFPIEGMFTRNVLDKQGRIYEYELSTPGLKGQSGSPLFDSGGVIYGMQSETAYLHLGFDQENAKVRVKGRIKEVDDHPFLHVGRCITVDVIKAFLKENGVKFYVG